MFGINILQNPEIQNINFNNPTWDMFILLLFITIAFFYGIFIGRDKILHLLLSSVFAFLIVKIDPFLSYVKGLKESEISVINMFLFLFLTIFFYIMLIKRSILSNIDSCAPRFFHVFVFSFLHSGLMISLSLNLLDDKTLSNFGPLIHNIFINNIALFLWIFCSILAIIFIKGNKE
ncbi:MAG TPA: hypothetical protein PLM63_02280 [bacterium]|nr:hypothetical protein [Patescibacteria group bacterium]HPO11383.1 hypothetical protein [bacterium]HQL11819.1 hypothetical protein [bacterium]